MEQPALIVMAAGLGSRYGGFKQIEPVGPNGEIILDYSIYDALTAGFQKIIFVIRKEIEQDFRNRIERSIAPHCETLYVFQELDNLPAGIFVSTHRTKPWGTAHAVMSCKNLIENPFAVINADDFYGRTAFQSLGNFLINEDIFNNSHRFCMVGYRLNNTLTDYGYVARGICDVDHSGYLLAVHELTHIEKFGNSVRYIDETGNWSSISGDSVVSMNMWGFTPSLFFELEKRFSQFINKYQNYLQEAEFFLPDVVNDLLIEKKTTVQVFETNEQWFGITYKPDKARLVSAVLDLINQGIYPETLWGN